MFGRMLRRVREALAAKIPSKVFETCGICCREFQRVGQRTCCDRCLDRVGADLALRGLLKQRGIGE